LSYLGAIVDCEVFPVSQLPEVVSRVPDNRELATAILVLGFLIFGLTVRKAREQIPSIVRSAAPLAPLFIVYFVSASVIVWTASSIGLWTPDLSWSTLIVIFGLGIALLSSAVNARSVHALWDAVAGKTLGATVFVGLYTNVATFSIVAEIALQALATLAVILRVVASHQGQKGVPQLADAVLWLIGLALVTRTTIFLAHGMTIGEWHTLLKQVLLAIWFPFALIPLLYFVSYLSTVEMAVVGVQIVKPRDIEKWPVIRRFLLAFRLRLSLAAGFDRTWGRRYANAEGSRARREVLAQFRQVERPRFELPEPPLLARLKRVVRRPEEWAVWDGRAMPRGPEPLAQLLRAKPPGWEWMAFGAQLWIGLADKRDRYRAHRCGHATPKSHNRLEGRDAMSYLADAIRTGGRLAESINDIFDEARQERAFGPPGEPGSPAEIRQMANEFISVYLALINWGSEVRGTGVPFSYRRTYRAAARLMDGPIAQLRHFVASLTDQLDALPDHFASGSKRPLNITLTLALSIRPADQARFDRSLSRLGNKLTGAPASAL